MHKDYQALFEKNRAVFEEFALRVKTKLVSQPFVFPHSALKAIELGRELEQLVLETIKDIKEAGPNDKAEIYQIIRKEFGRLEFIHGEKAQA